MKVKQTFYVVSHKEYWHSANPNYQMLHVGATASKDHSNALRDDSGISIAEKNRHYCELTGLYWIWKNDQDSDIIGLCHYRRYFAFQRKPNPFLAEIAIGVADTMAIENLINPQGVAGDLDLYDAILPVPEYLDQALAEHYCAMHRQADWVVLKKVIEELYPEYIPAMAEVFQGRSLYAYNMFVMKKAKFASYMKWLFAILAEVERRIPLSSDNYQTRVFGFMAERLLTLYVYHCQFRIKELPIVFINEDNRTSYRYKKLRQLIHEGVKKFN